MATRRTMNAKTRIPGPTKGSYRKATDTTGKDKP